MKRTVLIIDDDPNTQRLVSYAFAAEGYAVMCASSGREAFALIGAEPPDLIILDVMMPDMGGLEVCRWLRSKPATARIPVIMLSGRTQSADRDAGLQSGANDYFAKPADLSELVARGAALLAAAPAAEPVRAVAQRRGAVLAVVGARGGAGATTVAANLAQALAEAGQVCYAVELQPGPGAMEAVLGVQAPVHLGSLLAKSPDDLSEEAALRAARRVKSRLSLIAAPPVPSPLHDLTPALADALLLRLSSLADWIVVDLGASLHSAGWAVLKRASTAAIVTRTDGPSLGAATALLGACAQVMAPGRRCGLVAIGAWSEGSQPSPPPATVAPRLLGTIPPAILLCQRALQAGAPLVRFSPDHAAAVAIRRLAESLAGEPVPIGA